MKKKSADNTLQALRKLKVDCLFKKSTHFNAARRIKTGSERFRWALILGTIFASFSTIMNVGIWDKIPGDNTAMQVIINVLGAFGGFLILYTTTFSDYKSKIEIANKHENVANDLNLIFKRTRNTEAKFLDDIIDKNELSDALDTLTNEYISKCGNAPITNDDDYLKAKENYNKGYTAEYTDDELKS
jgi:hypothetical protein